MDAIASTKKRLREQWNKMPQRSMGQMRSVSERISECILLSHAFRVAERVAIFYPREWEVDLTALWHHRPKVCAFPRLVPGTRRLAFHTVDRLEDLSPGFADIPEPPDRPETHVTGWGQTDLILAPGLFFDLWGGRLGSGLGLYDRFLAGIPSQKWGVLASHNLFHERLAQCATDVRMDALVSEHGLREVLKK